MGAHKDFMQDADFKKRLIQEEFILEVTEVICKIMRDKGISRKELSNLMGKSKASISQLLNGERNLTLRTVADILNVLGCRGILKYEEIQKNNQNKENVLIFLTQQVHQSQYSSGTNWEFPKEPLYCDDYGNDVTSIGVI
jgi:transcriptional regulator with XRE-family HTH domain